MNKKGWIKKPEQIKDFADQNDDISNKGAYRNLMNQLNKAAKHSKGISLVSQRQYYNHMDHFCRYIADHYNLKNLNNIQDKHVVAYVSNRQNEGKSAASVKQDIAAIRYFHDQMTKPRYYLSDNQALAAKFQGFSLERRFFGGVNRRVTENEYQGLVNLANDLNHPQTAQIIQLAREQGLRIHEIVRLDKSDAQKALKTDELVVKGKGGLIRNVPLREQTRDILKESISHVQHGEKLFVRSNEKAHMVIQRVQDFMRNHRSKILDPFSERPEGVHITMHSFRHTYAKEQYNRFIREGLDEKKARYETSLLIGHSREDVTRIYLGE